MGMVAWTPWFALVLVGSALAAGLDAIGSVAGYGLIQRRARDAVRGRVFAAQSTAGLSANMVGFIVVGPLVEALGPQAVYGLGGIVSVVAALTFLIPNPKQRGCRGRDNENGLTGRSRTLTGDQDLDGGRRTRCT
jgi:MFS family permease